MVGKFKTVLIDLSGTLHVENEATPNSVQALKRLRASGVAVKFVTNTTKESRRVLHDRLTSLGFQIETKEIFTSLHAARDLIKRERLKPLLLIDDAAVEDFSDVTQFDGRPNAVVVGLAPDKFNRKNLNEGFRLLLDGAQLIAIHEGRYYKTKTGLSLGPGPFVKALEYASGLKAKVVGKPNEEFFKSALKSFESHENTNVSSCVMIGDDVRDDILGATKIGMSGYLVQTGKYRNGDEKLFNGGNAKVFKNFEEAVNDIISHPGN